MNVYKILAVLVLVLSLFGSTAEGGIILLLLIKLIMLKGALIFGVPLAIGSFILGQGVGFFAGKLFGGLVVLHAAHKYHKKAIHGVKYGHYGHGHHHGHYGHYGHYAHPAYGSGYNLGSKIAHKAHPILSFLKGKPSWLKGKGFAYYKPAHSYSYSSHPASSGYITTSPVNHGHGWKSSLLSSLHGKGDHGIHGDTGYHSSHSHHSPGIHYASSGHISGSGAHLTSGYLDGPGPYGESGHETSSVYGAPSTSVSSDYGAPSPSNSEYGAPSVSSEYGTPGGTEYGAPSSGGSSSGYQGTSGDFGSYPQQSQPPSWMEYSNGKSGNEQIHTHTVVEANPHSHMTDPDLNSPSDLPFDTHGKYIGPGSQYTGLLTPNGMGQPGDKNFNDEKTLLQLAGLDEFGQDLGSNGDYVFESGRGDIVSEETSALMAKTKAPNEVLERYVEEKLKEVSKSGKTEDERMEARALIKLLQKVYVKQLLDSFTEKDGWDTKHLARAIPNGTTEKSTTLTIPTWLATNAEPSSTTTTTTSTTSTTTPRTTEVTSTSTTLKPTTEEPQSQEDDDDTIAWIKIGAGRRRRDVPIEDTQSQTVESLGSDLTKFFTLVSIFDQDNCLQKLVCDVHTRKDSPGLGNYESNIVATFKMMGTMFPQHGKEDSTTKFRNAAHIGASTQSEKMCQNSYPLCSYNAQHIIKLGSQVEAAQTGSQNPPSELLKGFLSDTPPFKPMTITNEEIEAQTAMPRV